MLDAVAVVDETVDAAKRPGKHTVNGTGATAPMPVAVASAARAYQEAGAG